VSKSGKAVVLLSGGLDSTTLLAHLKFLDYEVLPFSVYYGQRHKHELRAVEQVCSHYGLQAYGVDMVSHLTHLTDRGPTGFIQHAKLFAGSSQTDPSISVPHGHYTDESMKVTIVPNRNMLLLALATAYAISNGAEVVAYAAHAGDHAIYPDCRPEFAIVMNEAIRIASDDKVYLERPFVNLTKADIVKRGYALKAPLHLTWSCYDPQKNSERKDPNFMHCGRCGTCVERKEAFELAEIPDPTIYKNWGDTRGERLSERGGA
jgi:7-cyano-7-deazaguanine synthase